MVTRTATLRLQLIEAVSGPAKNASNALKGIDGALARFGRGGTPEIRRLVKQLEFLQKKAGSIEDFTASRRGFKDLSTQMAAARSNVSRLEQALKSATKPTAKMKSELESARSVLKSTTSAFREQGVAVRQSERALQSYGIAGRRGISSSQQAIRNEIARTIREMRRLDREARKPKPSRQPPPPRQPPGPRPPGGGSAAYEAATAAAGGYIAMQGRNIAEKSFFTGIDFNQAAEYQAALGDFKGNDRLALNRQAEKIGGDTRFSNVDVVRAQTTILQRGIRDTKQIMDLTQKVTDYALAMGVTLEEGAEAVTGSALSKRIDLTDTKAISNFVDFMVWMAKNGGMSNEDVSQFIKYGGGPTTGAGLPDPYMAAMGMILRRSGVRGDEAGVFARSASSKLVAPTKKGRDALAAMGIDFNKFTTTGAMNTEGVGIMMKNNFGERITPEMQAAITELINNGEFVDPQTGENRSVISDSGEFVTQMSAILSPLFADSKGKVAVRDANALAKALADYQKYSVDSVDVVGLINAIAASDPTLGNLNAFFTDRQGGRANMIFQQWPLFTQLLEMMNNVPGGVANKIGTEANQGIYGDWTKLTGTVETALLRISQDWEAATRPMIRGIDSTIDGFTRLPESTRRLIEAFAAAAAVLAGAAAFRAGTGLLGRLFGMGGGAAAAGGGAAAAAGGGTAFGGLLARYGGKGLLRLLGPAGAAYTGYEIGSTLGKGAQELGSIAGGKHWMPPDRESRDDLVALAEEKRQRIAQIRANSRMPEMADNLIRPIQSDLDALEARIRAFDQMSVKPQIDTSSIDIAKARAEALKAALSGISAPTAPGSAAAATPPAVAGARARGGPVQAGKTYLTGEKGVELFTPGANGFITPNNRIGGGGTSVVVHQHNHFHGSGGNGQDMGDIVRTLDRQLNRAAQVAFSGIPYGDK
ncbi:phage tail tape measure protein [Rhizobium sp. SSA_523]|uniref:phage tail tape measure protein n=1 Tax=Rhizobium sp. SSA_523 TaxID=2952477 RepID=UPI0020919862|nr:phage tail tape measure protein [Rhizobium sp. SSA_523]MCO5730069.1 phage tail tape measure protein [Rhizobium sp. SSA_523]WKC25135.1 phage tail tape measure protein [Rhizobium sp. SSA_523]